jgi:PAS domain S-box-containing protein
MAPERQGIVMVDLQGEVTFANSFFCDLMGTTLEKTMGFSCFQFVFADDLEKARMLLEANKLPDPKPFRFRLKHASGSPVAVQIQGTPLKSPDGRIYGVLATIIPEDA